MTIRQLRMLDEMGRGISVRTATSFNQNIFGSLCLHKWVEYDIDSEQFKVSSAVKQECAALRLWSTRRKHNNGLLSGRANKLTRKLRRVA